MEFLWARARLQLLDFLLEARRLVVPQVKSETASGPSSRTIHGKLYTGPQNTTNTQRSYLLVPGPKTRGMPETLDWVTQSKTGPQSVEEGKGHGKTDCLIGQTVPGTSGAGWIPEPPWQALKSGQGFRFQRKKLRRVGTWHLDSAGLAVSE